MPEDDFSSCVALRFFQMVRIYFVLVVNNIRWCTELLKSKVGSTDSLVCSEAHLCYSVKYFLFPSDIHLSDRNFSHGLALCDHKHRLHPKKRKEKKNIVFLAISSIFLLSLKINYLIHKYAVCLCIFVHKAMKWLPVIAVLRLVLLHMINFQIH